MLLRSLFLWMLLVLGVSAKAEPRAPTGNWTVNSAAAQCIAYRDYGTAEQRLRLVLKAPPLGDVMQIAVVRKGTMFRAEQVDATIAVDERPPIQTNVLMFGSKGNTQVVYLLNMPSAEFALVRQGKQLRLRSQRLNETFELSEMEPLLKIMEECTADLRQVWNVRDPDAPPPTGLERRAMSNLARYFSDADYPIAAVMAGLSGTVRFAILVGEDGRVVDCTVIGTSGIAVLDARACILIKRRARFQPALDKDGKPTKDAVLGAIQWDLR